MCACVWLFLGSFGVIHTHCAEELDSIELILFSNISKPDFMSINAATTADASSVTIYISTCIEIILFSNISISQISCLYLFSAAPLFHLEHASSIAKGLEFVMTTKFDPHLGSVYQL